MPAVSRPGPDLRRDRAVHGPGRLAHHPRARDRLVAAGVARPEPARHPRHPGLRRGPSLARAAEEGPRLDPLYRGDAHGPGVRRLHPGGDAARAQAEGGAELHGDVHRRAEVRAGDVRQDRERADEEAGLALHGEHRVPRVPRQAAPAGGAAGEVRRARHRRHVAAAAQAAGGDLPALGRRHGAPVEEAGEGASGEGAGRLPDRARPRAAARRADGPRPGLSLARAQHAHALPGRAPAPPDRHPGAQQPVRRRVRAGRAVGRSPPGRHRVAAPGARPAQGGGQLDLRDRARARRHAPRRLDRGRGAGRGAARRARCCTAGRSRG